MANTHVNVESDDGAVGIGGHKMTWLAADSPIVTPSSLLPLSHAFRLIVIVCCIMDSMVRMNEKELHVCTSNASHRNRANEASMVA